MTAPPSQADAIRRAGRIYAETLAACAQMTPRQQAEAAWSPTSRFTVDELEQRIRARRGLIDRAVLPDAV